MTGRIHTHTKRRRIRIRRFIPEYLIDLNGSAAIQRIGFKGKRPDVAAAKLLAHPYAQELLDREVARRAQRVEIDQDYVLRTITEQIERHRPRYDGESGRLVLKGAELAGSHLGMWKNKHEHSGPGGKPLQPPTISISFPDGGPGTTAAPAGDGVETS